MWGTDCFRYSHGVGDGEAACLRSRFNSFFSSRFCSFFSSFVSFGEELTEEVGAEGGVVFAEAEGDGIDGFFPSRCPAVSELCAGDEAAVAAAVDSD